MPHVPLFVSNRRWGRSLRGRYGDVIEELDWSVGRILDKLGDLGIDRNTLVVYTSDNGPWLQYGIDAGSAGPFRLGKSTTWEGGMRVPGIFWMPGSIPAGRVTSAVAANMDLLPTFAGLAGSDLPDDRVLDGRDLWPLLSGASEESPHDYFYFFHGSRPGAPPRMEGIREGRYKLRLRSAASGELEALQLYDLLADAGEKFDIRERHPALVGGPARPGLVVPGGLGGGHAPAGRPLIAYGSSMDPLGAAAAAHNPSAAGPLIPSRLSRLPGGGRRREPLGCS